jgi:Na+/melibiose symporter-like transporter
MDMKESGPPLSRVALLGLAAGAAAGFVTSLMYMWLDTEAGQGFVFNWQAAVIFVIVMGPMFSLFWVFSVRRYRNKTAGTASGSTEHGTTSEIR